MANIVFNNQLETFGQRFITGDAQVPDGMNSDPQYNKQLILAELFEQFLLFDKIALKIDRQNLPLYFLIRELGINKVEELLDRGILIPVLWTPQIFTSVGRQQPDGTIDRDSVIGTPPLVTGTLSDEDSDPEHSIDKLLRYFQVHPDRRKSFKRKVRNKYVLPDNVIAAQSKEIIIEAYNNNRLANLGLPANKLPEQLDYLERTVLQDFGLQILETTVLASNGYKSYDNYVFHDLTKESVQQIESAYHVSENTSQIFRVENLANIQQLVLENKIPFDRVFDIRYADTVKHYRKWINEVSVDTDALEVTREYIDEVTGKSNFFNSAGGKFVRTGGMMAIGAGIGAAIGALPGAFAGGAVGKIADIGLTLLDTYLLDGILKGWNPRMFVDQMRVESGNDRLTDRELGKLRRN